MVIKIKDMPAVISNAERNRIADRMRIVLH